MVSISTSYTKTQCSNPVAVSWSSDSQSTLRLVDLPTIDTFVLVHSPDNTLYRSTLSVFSPNYSTPIRQKHIRHKVNRLIALPGSTRDSLEFVGVAFSGEVLRFGDDVSYSRARRNKVEKKDEKDLSIWQEMFGKDAFVNLDLATASADEVNVGSGAEVKRKTGRPSEVFDGPSHTLPPPSLLFDSFIDQLLGNPIDNMAARPTEQEEGILYESGVAQETRIDGPVTLVPEVKGRQVTDQEVKEVQTLFEQILSCELRDARTRSELMMYQYPRARQHPLSQMVMGSRALRTAYRIAMLMSRWTSRTRWRMAILP